MIPDKLAALGYTEDDLEMSNPYNPQGGGMDKPDANQIQNALSHFTGSEQWYRYSPLFPNVLLTDGAMYVAQTCSAFWLMDMIASHIPSIKDYFAIAILDKGQWPGTWVFRIVDDIPSKEVYAVQEIEYSDFPLDDIKLYVINDDVNWTILLPSEY